MTTQESNSNLLFLAAAVVLFLLLKKPAQGKGGDDLTAQVKAFNKGSKWVSQNGSINLKNQGVLSQYTTGDLQRISDGTTDTLEAVPVLTLNGIALTLPKGFYLGSLVGIRAVRILDQGKVKDIRILKIQPQHIFKPAQGSDGYLYTQDTDLLQIS